MTTAPLSAQASGVTKKLPQITLIFWIMKIAATTLGETGGDLLAQTLKIGYAVSSLLFIGLFLVTVGFDEIANPRLRRQV